MENSDSNQLLELYKLHAELADRVSQRRETANRLYVSLLTGIFILFAAVLRFGTDPIPVWIIVLVGAIGIAVSIAWFFVIRSYRQLNTGKFKVLVALEEKLAYTFFKHEWTYLKKGSDIKKHIELTIAEFLLPVIFAVVFLSIIVGYVFF